MVSGYKLYEMRLPDPARYAFIRTSVVTSHKSNHFSSALRLYHVFALFVGSHSVQPLISRTHT